MELKVGKFLITNDDLNYIVNTKKKIKDEFQWMPSKYFSTLGGCVNYIAQQTPKENEEVKSVLAELREIKKICNNLSKEEFTLKGCYKSE